MQVILLLCSDIFTYIIKYKKNKKISLTFCFVFLSLLQHSHTTGPSTVPKCQRLPLLGAKGLTPKFDFSSLSVLSKTVENENFNQNWHNSYSKSALEERCT